MFTMLISLYIMNNCSLVEIFPFFMTIFSGKLKFKWKQTLHSAFSPHKSKTQGFEVCITEDKEKQLFPHLGLPGNTSDWQWQLFD